MPTFSLHGPAQVLPHQQRRELRAGSRVTACADLSGPAGRQAGARPTNGDLKSGTAREYARPTDSGLSSARLASTLAPPTVV
jgi:hypothetical protein